MASDETVRQYCTRLDGHSPVTDEWVDQKRNLIESTPKSAQSTITKEY